MFIIHVIASETNSVTLMSIQLRQGEKYTVIKQFKVINPENYVSLQTSNTLLMHKNVILLLNYCFHYVDGPTLCNLFPSVL